MPEEAGADEDDMPVFVPAGLRAVAKLTRMGRVET